MAKSKYAQWLESFGLEAVRRLAEDGLPDEEIAARVALELSVFRCWKRRYPEFAEAISLGRAAADYEVIRSLYKKAVGYNVAVNKTYKLKRVDYDPETGKKLREYEELATGVDETHVPADLRAETFWLKNRQSDRWSERSERGGGDGEGYGVVELPEADMIDGED
ncbi:MAG: hypothetical protein IJY39_09745 [Clostridia bacterium]|nr:hypothetical protein [Clostridia bacterium]